MAKLRKRMKKNAIWTPSETMIRRELADAGRGPDNYRSRKAEAEERGEEFTDVDNIATTAPGKQLAPGEISADSLGLAETNLSNRGMKLNEAKKLKREAMLAASAEELKAASNRVADLGSNFKQLFSNPPSTARPAPTAIIGQKEKTSKKERKEKHVDDTKTPTKKRKRDDETSKAETPKGPPELMASPEIHTKKKKKTAPAPPTPTSTVTQTTTTTVPLAAPAPSPPKPAPPTKSIDPTTPTMPAPGKPKIATTPTNATFTATSSRPRRISLTLRGPSEPSSALQQSPRTSSRPSSLRGSIAPSSAGPTSATFPRDHLRRKSATPATPASPVKPMTAASRRSKRPAPGALVKDQEGGATVSVGKRQHAPKKGISIVKRAAEHADARDKENAVKTEEVAAGDEIDPNEPRYCLCGDVSYGEMVGCDNDDVSASGPYAREDDMLTVALQCEREWFHFGCVGLTEHPPRRTKWYCPDCRELGFSSKK